MYDIDVGPRRPRQRYEAIPSSLDRLGPDHVTACFLASVEVDQLSGHDRVVVVRALQRVVSHFQARLFEAVGSVVDFMRTDPDEEDFPEEAASAEVRAALRLTRSAADGIVGLALELRDRLPRVWEALNVGEIDVRRARVLIDGTLHLRPESARGVVDMIISDAGLMTTGQLRARLRKLCIEADPDEAKERYERAVEHRRVAMEPTVDGTADVFLTDLPVDRAVEAMASINEQAKRMRGAGESRSIDQLRADIALDRLEGNSDAAGNVVKARGAVSIRVDGNMLAGLTESSGDLGGYGPVMADIARQIVARQRAAEWTWELIDHETGAVLDVGTTRRRPSTNQRRYVEARDPRCVFPGCRMPISECDIDHTVPYQESTMTRVDQLAPLCKHDHLSVRHRLGWTYQRLDNGDYLFRSPLGHAYTTSGGDPAANRRQVLAPQSSNRAGGESTTRGRDP